MTWRRRFRGASAGYLLIAPAVAATVLFLVIPMVVSAWWSLTHYNGIKAPEFVGDIFRAHPEHDGLPGARG